MKDYWGREMNEEQERQFWEAAKLQCGYQTTRDHVIFAKRTIADIDALSEYKPEDWDGTAR